MKTHKQRLGADTTSRGPSATRPRDAAQTATKRTALAVVLLAASASADVLRDLLRPSPSADPLAPEALLAADSLVRVHVPTLGDAIGINHLGTAKFLGIPYALPPVGDLRWAAPVELANWASYTGPAGVLNATLFAPACPSAVAAGSWIRSEEEGESCLFLNVWTPRGHVEAVAAGTARPLAVVVWLHGGGFIMGSASNPSTSPPPDQLVANGQLLFVSMNYRLGAFASISSSAMGGGGGFFSILDQQLAMRWVAAHIAAFGGDPTRVTLQGESAGAISICLHLTMPSSRGLFSQAIIESALCGFPFENAVSGRQATQRLAHALGCAWDQNAEAYAARLNGAELRRLQPPQHKEWNVILPDHLKPVYDLRRVSISRSLFSLSLTHSLIHTSVLRTELALVVLGLDD